MSLAMETIFVTQYHLDNYIGICVECGEEKDGCEPDARNYVCDACFCPTVFGAEELLLMGANFDDTEMFDQE